MKHILKHNSFLLLLLTCVGLTTPSCKKEEAPQSRKLMIGTWQIKSMVTTQMVNNVAVSTVTNTNFSSNDYLQFNDDGTGYVSIKKYDNTPYGNIRFVSNQLNENSVNGDFPFEITKINKSVLEIVYGYSMAVNGQNMVTKYEVVLFRR